MGISDTMIGNLLLLALAALVLLLISYINAVLARRFKHFFSSLGNKFGLSNNRFNSIFRVQIFVGRIIAASLFIYSLSIIFADQAGGISKALHIDSLLQIIVTLSITVFLVSVLWELSNAAIEIIANRSRHISDSRAETVLPVVRNVLLTFFLIILSLIFLSELGIDIVPLLAGAGVVGVALGFGAQALVKDFLTGFIVIIEDLFQVGDVIKVGDRRGKVEKITLRKVQLRDLDGTVHTVPFSDVSVVDNYTKIYSYYLLDIGVAYRENVDDVIECLKQIDKELREDSDYKNSILEPLEVLGLDQFADSAVIVRARTKTRAKDKWLVGREFNKRIKSYFDEKGIEIPFPHQTIYFGEDKKGNAPAANIALMNSEKSEK
jgi:small conductance mechanosensitive channel